MVRVGDGGFGFVGVVVVNVVGVEARDVVFKGVVGEGILIAVVGDVGSIFSFFWF